MTILDLPTIRRGKHVLVGCGFDPCRICEDLRVHIQADRIAADAKSHRAPKHAAVYSFFTDVLWATFHIGGTHRAEAAAFERASA